MRHNTAIVIPAIAILLFSFGIIYEPQNAYAGIDESENGNGENGNGEENAIWCEVFGEWERETGFWKNGGDSEFFAEGECLIILNFEELVVDVEVEGELAVEEIEDDCKDVETELTIFIDDEGFEGTIEAIAEGEICRNRFTETEQDIEITGGTGDFSNIVGGEGSFTSVMRDRGGFFEAEIHASLEVSGHTHLIQHPTGGSSYKNNQQPSVGITETGNRVVDGGITVNGQTVDANFYFTPFPLIQSPIGKPIDFVFKIWDDRLDNIKHLQLQLGKGKIGESFTKVASATYDRNKMTGLVTVTHDPMFTNVVMEQLADQPCRTGSNDCTVIHVRLTPTQPIIGDVVWGLYIWDEAGNAVTIFFNEGIEIGTEADVVIVDDTIPKVIKKQLRTDDGWGNIDKRYSKAFAMKAEWNMNQINKIVADLGY